MKRLLLLLLLPMLILGACTKEAEEAPAAPGDTAPAAPDAAAGETPDTAPGEAAEETEAAADETTAEAAGEPIEVTESVVLFDGSDLDNWVLFLGEEGADPESVWTVQEGVVHCTGEPAGYMRTKNRYKNYRLSFDWRWPGEGGNNGALIHIQLPDMVWPKSIEAQLQADNAGDLWVIEGADFDEHTDPENRRVEKRNISTEFEPGEWNNMIVECRPESIHVYVNEALQNIATNPTVNSGFIGLQSEGTPIEFRDIRLDPL